MCNFGEALAAPSPRGDGRPWMDTKKNSAGWNTSLREKRLGESKLCTCQPYAIKRLIRRLSQSF